MNKNKDNDKKFQLVKIYEGVHTLEKVEDMLLYLIFGGDKALMDKCHIAENYWSMGAYSWKIEEV